MADYTSDEIEDAVIGEGADSYDTYDGGWYELAYQDPGHREIITLRGQPVNLEIIASESGCEGGGEYVWIVVRVGTQLFKKEGCYLSHVGTEWDGDLKEVHAIERTVTFYE